MKRTLRLGLPIVVLAALIVAGVLLATTPWGDQEAAGGQPTPSASGAGSRSGNTAASSQMTYVGTNGGIWLVNAGGSGKRKLADNPCGSPPRIWPNNDLWSPNGDKFALVCRSPEGYDGSLHVVDETGKFIAAVKGPTTFRWSPDGRQIAYQVGWPLPPETPTYSVRVRDLATSQDSVLRENAILLEWPLPDRMLLGLNVHGGDSALQYDAQWLDVETGEISAVTRFDNLAPFWLTADAKAAIVLSRTADRDTGGAVLGTYNLETGQERPIPSGVIGYQSEGIPRWQVAVSADGQRVYWVDSDQEEGDALYSANIDGSGLSALGRVPGRVFALSGDGLVAYLGDGRSPGTIFVADLKAGTTVEVAEGYGEMGWRPTP